MCLRVFSGCRLSVTGLLLLLLTSVIPALAAESETRVTDLANSSLSSPQRYLLSADFSFDANHLSQLHTLYSLTLSKLSVLPEKRHPIFTLAPNVLAIESPAGLDSWIFFNQFLEFVEEQFGAQVSIEPELTLLSAALLDQGSPRFFESELKVGRFFIGPSTPADTAWQLLGLRGVGPGHPSTGIAIIDMPLNPEEAWYPNEIRPPDRMVDLGTAVPANSPTTHGSMVSWPIWAKSNQRFSSGICPDCSRSIYGIGGFNPYANASQGSLPNIRLLTSQAIAQLERARLDQTVQIVNLSWGVPFPSPALRRAVRSVIDAGKTVVAATGNESMERTPIYPAGWADVLAAGSNGEIASWGSLTATNQKSVFANGGAKLTAPGFSRTPRFLSGMGMSTSSLYESGTSFSSPEIAGVLGLLRSTYSSQPGSFPLLQAKTPGELREYLEEVLFRTARDIGTSAGFDQDTGYGQVDAAAAITTLLGDHSASVEMHPGLVYGIQENLDHGNPESMLNREMQRLASSASSDFKLPFHETVGSCSGATGALSFLSGVPISKIIIHRPKVHVDVSNYSLSWRLASQQAQADFSYDYAAGVDISLDLFTQINCWIPLIPPLRITLHLDWAPRSFLGGNGPLAPSNSTIRGLATYRLRGSYQELHQQTQRSSWGIQTSLSGLPTPFLTALARRFIDRNITPFFRDIFAPALEQQMFTMTRLMLDSTLNADRSQPEAFFGYRIGRENSELVASSPGSSFGHFPNPASSRSSFAVVKPLESQPAGAAHPWAYSPAAPVPPPAFGPSSRSTSVYANPSFLYKQLLEMVRRGHFELGDATVHTSTPQVPNVSIGIHDVSIAQAPTVQIFPNINTEGHSGELGFVFDSRIVAHQIDAPPGPGVPVRFEIAMPIIARDSYKDRNSEANHLIAGRRENRITVAFDSIRVGVIGWDPASPSSAPTHDDLRTTFLWTHGLHLVRLVQSLSTYRVGLEASLGADWGTIKQMMAFAGHYRSGLKFEDLAFNGFDLNMGEFRSNLTPDFGSDSNGNFVRSFSLIPHQPIEKQPMATLSPLTSEIRSRAFPNHNGQIAFSRSVRGSFAPKDDTDAPDELFLSIQGRANLALNHLRKVRVVEQLWDLGTVQADPGEIVIWLPNWIEQAPNSTPADIFALPRDSEEGTRGDRCLPELHTGFTYDQTGATPFTASHRKLGGFSFTQLSASRYDSVGGDGCASALDYPGILISEPTGRIETQKNMPYISVDD